MELSFLKNFLSSINHNRNGLPNIRKQAKILKQHQTPIVKTLQHSNKQAE